MPVIAYKVQRLPLWRPIGFSQSDLSAFGSAATGIMVNRIRRGINVRDVPARPLSKAYLKLKTRRGRAAVRDWNLTGATLAAMGVVRLNSQSVAIGVDWRIDQKAFQIALFNQAIEPMAGLSPSDRRQMRDLIHQSPLQRVAA